MAHEHFMISQMLMIELRVGELKLPTEAMVNRIEEKELWLDVFAGPAMAAGLAIGSPVRITYYDDRGMHQGESTLVGVIEPQIPRIAVRMPKRMSSTQRRAFFRLGIERPMSYIRTPVETAVPEEEKQDSSVVCCGQLINLSGGGVAFSTPQQLTVGDRITATLNLADDCVITSQARVVRDLRPEEKVLKAHPFAYGAEFISLTERHRDRIIALLFDCQRKRCR